MGKRSREKGHTFERLIAASLRHIYPEAKRKLEYQEDTCVGVDLENTGPWTIQCKRHKTYVPVVTIEEVQGNRPVVVTKADNRPTMVIMQYEDFLYLLESSTEMGGCELE